MIIYLPLSAEEVFSNYGSISEIFWDFSPDHCDLTGIDEQIEAMMKGWA